MLKYLIFYSLFFIPSFLFAEPFQLIIDPGHGGSDFGATVINEKARLKESELTLSLALQIQKIAAQKYSKELKVILTRSKNNYIALDERVKSINQNDLLLSIHYNSADSPQIYGTEIYFPENQTKKNLDIKSDSD